MSRHPSTPLTGQQTAMLRALFYAHAPLSGPDLAQLLYDKFRTPEGVHQTAASLVRRGLAARAPRSGFVRYEITDRGRQLARLSYV